ncbi:hypothetical protein DFR58_101306 [Anaerobacterium chartisolvens]|uniref:Flavodoxin-like protein n=1 Tax=Anaerobacterium chartisolvens TaxID=1297424 RepID=A0A369BKI8_9FIRM|nr:hypothetical protein DFR58_101306 [Anaerobacterium chartisolvens]
MVGIHLSGTGNTKCCIERLVHLLDEQAKTIPIEDDRAVAAIKENEIIVLGYPVQLSNAPVMVRDFIKNYAGLWQDKKIETIAAVIKVGKYPAEGLGLFHRIAGLFGQRLWF